MALTPIAAPTPGELGGEGVAELPMPPDDCADLDLTVLSSSDMPPEVVAGQVWMRCSGASYPLTSAPHRDRPRYRFDCPVRLDGSARFRVWYGARTELGALCEVFGEPSRRRVTVPDRTSRVVGGVTWRRELRLIDVRAPRVVAIDRRRDPGLDGRFSSHGDYRLTRAWADAIFRCRDEVDGLLYLGRKSGDLCVALFHDRCESALEQSGSLRDVNDPALEPTWQAFEKLTAIKRAY